MGYYEEQRAEEANEAADSGVMWLLAFAVFALLVLVAAGG